MEVIALADGDLVWIFPHLDNPQQVHAALSEADADIRRLAEHLGVRPGWTGSGLEFDRYGGRTFDLHGFAETADVSFLAELEPGAVQPDQPDQPGRARLTWEVTAQIAVRCDGQAGSVDCGMHTIEAWPASRHYLPLQAATALARAARWLLDRGTAEPVTYWRQHDPDSGHR